jgi:hypothetical protein
MPNLTFWFAAQAVDPSGCACVKQTQPLRETASVFQIPRRMGNKMVVVREHGPSFKILGEVARDGEQAVVQNIKPLRSAKIMRLKISPRSDEVGTAV